eukprot:TRINITY_DN911_c0_g1_i1.p1 TRINITY_DN911_c0_g1~~TRINITY_DN911_c0_g1_i1.p1  ORF type:complete len:70 (+),score=5.23 TRINITY_DN911_c0_g1_i1:181-390(+)
MTSFLSKNVEYDVISYFISRVMSHVLYFFLIFSLVHQDPGHSVTPPIKHLHALEFSCVTKLPDKNIIAH